MAEALEEVRLAAGEVVRLEARLVVAAEGAPSLFP